MYLSRLYLYPMTVIYRSLKCYVRQLVGPLDRLIRIYFLLAITRQFQAKELGEERKLPSCMLENCPERAFELVKHIIWT